MLYDDVQQLEVRYVISLDYHDVDVYSGGGLVPEGELWLKRSAIRLCRKPASAHDRINSLPFFLFSENKSEKEDFYFALLNNQPKGRDDSPPETQHFVVKDIISLVQKLHSSEEHLQTRWLNAIIGRLFLAMYKTPLFEAFFRRRITKKISRVRKPNFITKLALQKIEPGDGAPFITNPRLRDLTVDGDCTIEADVLYTGNFRVEVAATARIDLGSRIKAREVELVLAATCKKLQGHVLVRIKPPPSNRVWFTFEKAPKIDLAIEPVISTRQITYTVILRAIESRIREVIAETLVLPFWDDAFLFDTSDERFRGGIWEQETTVETTTEIPTEDPEDEAEAGPYGTQTPEMIKAIDERTMSMPVLNGQKEPKAKNGKKSVSSLAEVVGTSTSIERSPRLDSPRLIRSSSFATAADPQITPNNVDADPTRGLPGSPKRPENASSILKDLSARSLTASPAESPAGTPPNESSLASAMKDRSISNASKSSLETSTPTYISQHSTSSFEPQDDGGAFVDDAEVAMASETGQGSQPQPKKGFIAAARSATNAERKQQALASINAATNAAQKWGWGVLQNRRQKERPPAESPDIPTIPAAPLGRGRPLPPPGVPLPPPERSSTLVNFNVPKRKPVPPPLLPRRPDNVNGGSPTPSPKPPLPDRKRRQSARMNENQPADEDVLVVAAPTESAPASPVKDEHQDDFFGHGEDEEPPIDVVKPKIAPALPPRKMSNDVSETASREEETSMGQENETASGRNSGEEVEVQ